MQEAERFVHPRDQLMRTMKRIYHYRMTTTSGGNLSIRDDQDGIWITPAGVDKGSLTRDDMVRVRPGGSFEGPDRPSSELPFHQAIYHARPELRGIVHAHPVALVAFSMNGQTPNTRLFHQARHVCGEVGFAPYALPGSTRLAESIAQAFAGDVCCVILENHGAVVAGKSLQQAFERFETLEFTAHTILAASRLGAVRYLDDSEIELPRQRAVGLDSFTRQGPPSSDEIELRRQVCEFVRRSYEQRLMIATEGSFSARLGEDSFLITPYQIDRSTVELNELVLIEDGKCEAGKTPSRATGNHQAIYRQHPEIGAVVNAYTVHATAFSATDTAFDSRTIPESYLLLRDVARVPYGVQFRDSEDLAQRISPQQPIALLDNDGVLVTGKNVLETFDRLEVLEATAQAHIAGLSLGSPSPMSDDLIAELRRAFALE